MQVNMQNEVAVLRSEMESQMAEIEDGISAGIEMHGRHGLIWGRGWDRRCRARWPDMQAEVMSEAAGMAEMAGMLSEAPGVVEQVKGQVAAAVEALRRSRRGRLRGDHLQRRLHRRRTIRIRAER